MATLCRTYSTPDVARQAADDLMVAGVPAHAIRLVIGGVVHDIRREPVGTFAGVIGPEARVGNYANALRLRRQGRGAFAGDPDGQRQGSFADTDRDVILTGDGHAHTTDDRVVRELLEGAALSGAAADDVLGALHHGRVVVLAEVVDASGRAVEAV
jgi:hypothetical protein